MGYAWKSIENGGGFINTETGAYFEYEAGTLNDWSEKHGATHTIFLIDDNTRPAKVLKTVAYVMIDEDASGPVWEKWQIRHRFIRKDGHLIYG